MSGAGLSLEVKRKSEVSDGSPGMGHDMDDYFDVTVTATVREGDRVVLTRSWTAGYDANGGTPAWLPELALDGRTLVARWPDGRQERIPIA